MTCEMEILDATGHVTLQWDPDDPESVARAESEFNAMRDAGFAFFTSAGPDAGAVEAFDGKRATVDGRLIQSAPADEAPLEQTRTFKPRARRTVAVKPMQGG